jgi:PAS domain S-box-containing protein
MATIDRAELELATMLRYAPTGFAAFSPEGVFERCNRAFERLLGYASAELRSRSFEALTHPDDRESCRQLFEQVRRGRRESFELERRFVRKDGRVIWSRVVVGAIRDAKGRVLHMVGTAEDISARKASEEAARRLAFLVDNAADAVASVDLDGRIQSWNRGAERLFGYSAGEVLGRVGDFLIPQSRMLETIIAREKIVRGQPVVRLETERLHKDGGLVRVLVTVSPIRDADGRILGASSIARDLTEKRRAEEALQRLSAVIHSATDAITGVDPGGRVTDWNEGAERLYGWKAAEIIGGDIMLICPAELLKEGNWIREEIKAGRRVERLDTKRMRKDGRIIQVQLSVAPVLDGGRIVGSSGISHDITARKRAQEDARRAKAELEARVAERTSQLSAANLELESFNAAVSHDLRGPLSTMGRCLDILAREACLDQTGRDSLVRASRAARRMDRLIDDMMQLARSRGAAMKRETVDLTALARGIMGELRLREPSRRVDFVCEPGLTARADRSLLKAALENLLGNAWKYTSKKSRARIEVGAKRDHGETVYFVRDDGAGFDMAYAPKLFRSFARLHSQREFEGTGVGLSIVRAIVERHGGRVWACAAVDRGATFFFTLPGAGRSDDAR